MDADKSRPAVEIYVLKFTAARPPLPSDNDTVNFLLKTILTVLPFALTDRRLLDRPIMEDAGVRNLFGSHL